MLFIHPLRVIVYRGDVDRLIVLFFFAAPTHSIPANTVGKRGRPLGRTLCWAKLGTTVLTLTVSLFHRDSVVTPESP
ncbi:MAG: hypothetical protein CM1200mP41_31140 [Gammaproteobacteria bacterium]|nr:MAG: hypothetical protein CM1200mP41_31140 [Gammaproteobacteria bacterium]